MIVPFLIMLREGIEAALIVGIVASYLAQTGRRAWMPAVWVGAAVAAAMCLAIGVALNWLSAEFPQRLQEMIEAAIGMIAVVVLTGMVFWMKRAAKSIGATMRTSIEAAFDRSADTGWALAAMAFFAVAREGLESVFFLLATFQQDVGIAAPIGAVAGLVVAVGFGAAITYGGVRIDLKLFFRWTGILILFVAAGLLAGSIRALHEAGIWNGWQAVVFDLSGVLPSDSVLGTLLGGMFGYQEAPTVSEVGVYLAYLLPALVLFVSARPAAIPAGAKR
ncbi:MAG: FTR1 family protein [Ancalomicrobiaceae bacterium]|nr:FTR1 family protein [Ancalomicrobiaceae bacterium]